MRICPLGTRLVGVFLTALSSVASAQTTYNAFDDFYVNVPATAGAGDYNQATWIANAGAVPFDTGKTNPNTWAYAGGNFNGGGFPSSVGTFVDSGSLYPLTAGGAYAGPGVSYALGGGNFFIGYNDQYGIASLPNAQTQIGKYTQEWFGGTPNYTANVGGTNDKYIWLQGTGLSESTDGLGAVLSWTAPSAGKFAISGSYVNGNYGVNTSFAIVDSRTNLLLPKQTLPPSSIVNNFSFTNDYAAGDVIQFQVGTPAAAQGSPLGLSVNIAPVLGPSTNVILTLQTSTNLSSQWQNMPITAGMITTNGQLNVGALTNTNTFYRLNIGTVVQ